ncbi:T9SS type A sorting domain-containing protein [Aureicoccus marinus]|uniref:Secretion system C-terminal sorting domain-containing protein n=1 Tax=Aureicoccus marinus TaxID=754435 RepID=A0A2S7TAG5_9FLAO|nr:T9SS type A sorting domain-containing protein [Aureicoccus marinus]PQJ16456.1 hypothetical protein BST99_12675 [Aureicoccus marinus]
MRKLFFLIIMALPLLTHGQEIASADRPIKTSPKTFKMYPNPAYGNQVTIRTSIVGTKEVKVFDVFGEMVMAENLQGHTLNISKLLPGVYVLQVKENDTTMTRKLVVK